MQEIWREYFKSEEERDSFKNIIMSDKNIIRAYIRTKNEKSLNYEINNKLLYELDEYNLKDGINSKIINTIKENLSKFFDEFNYFEGNLILKIKNILERKYRPLIIMSIEDEIAINCFLNILLEEISNNIKLSSVQFGNETPLLKYIDANNKEKYDEISDLYLERWQNSYNKYNDYLIDKLNSEKQVYITDIKNFYPSVKINKIFDKLELITKIKHRKIYEKVFTIKIANMDSYKGNKNIENENNLDEYGITNRNNVYLLTSLPQGTIFSPIFANIYLYDIKDLNLDIALYVDDIHLFSIKNEQDNDVNKLIYYLSENELFLNEDKTTKIHNKDAITDYKKLIKDYGSNVSILRSHTNKLDVDIENDKYILDNAVDIKDYLENKLKNENEDEKEIYNKYLNKINKTIKYRKERYYKYKSQNLSEYCEILEKLQSVLKYLEKVEEVAEDKLEELEMIIQTLGSYNSKLYDIEEYLKKLLVIYKISNNSFLDNILFRYLNRNLEENYNEFKEITQEKNNILFKEKFYELKTLLNNKKEIKIITINDNINIEYLEKDSINSSEKKNYLIQLFKEIINKKINNLSTSNIFYKVVDEGYLNTFSENDKEIDTIINIGGITPERIMINEISKIIKISLANKSVFEMNVWEYRLHILSKSYQREKEKYIAEIIENLEDSINNQFQYIEPEMICIMENNFIPKLWKENANCVDGILKLYLIVKRLWGHGSKNLYFYTLHNHEHTNVLLTNFEKFIKSNIWKLSLSQMEILYIYIVFVLHDIGMLWIENTSILNEEKNTLTEIVKDYYNVLEFEEKKCYESIYSYRVKNISGYQDKVKNKKIKESEFKYEQKYHAKELEDLYSGFLQNFTRELHGILAIKLIQNDNLGIKEIIKKMDLDLDIIYSLIFGHAELNKQIQFKVYNDIDIEKLNNIIKLIDTTDITSNRINEEFYKTFKEVIPEKSAENYDKHLNVINFEILNSKKNNNSILFKSVQKLEKIDETLKKQIDKFNQYLENKNIKLRIEYVNKGEEK